MSILAVEYVTPFGQVIQARHGDLTEEHVDAIVNTANEYLARSRGITTEAAVRALRDASVTASAGPHPHIRPDARD